jgi:hypothetical protein
MAFMHIAAQKMPEVKKLNGIPCGCHSQKPYVNKISRCLSPRSLKLVGLNVETCIWQT